MLTIVRPKIYICSLLINVPDSYFTGFIFHRIYILPDLYFTGFIFYRIHILHILPDSYYMDSYFIRFKISPDVNVNVNVPHTY